MTEYRVVFDILDVGYSGWHVAMIPAMVGAGFGLATFWSHRIRRRDTSASRIREGVILGAATLIAGVVALVIIAVSFTEHRHLREARRRGDGAISEGVVSDFVPEQPNGHPRESFAVGSRRFSYSSSDITSGFHWTAGRGGPIKEGMRVRIADIDGSIIQKWLRNFEQGG